MVQTVLRCGGADVVAACLTAAMQLEHRVAVDGREVWELGPVVAAVVAILVLGARGASLVLCFS